jgi:hypothetical protein
MRGGPTPDATPPSFKLVERNFVHTRLGVDHVRGSVEARAVDGGARRQALVEDARDDSQECGPESRPSGRARRERETVAVEHQERRHHALHPRSGLEPAAQQVGFPQHAVQVQVEAGDEISGAEPEAGREGAGVAVSIHD